MAFVHDDELDEMQSVLNQPAKWSWVGWASIQLSNAGDIADTFGKMFHDTALHLRWHAKYREQQGVFDDTATQIARLPEV